MIEGVIIVGKELKESESPMHTFAAFAYCNSSYSATISNSMDLVLWDCQSSSCTRTLGLPSTTTSPIVKATKLVTHEGHLAIQVRSNA